MQLSFFFNKDLSDMCTLQYGYIIIRIENTMRSFLDASNSVIGCFKYLKTVFFLLGGEI